MLKTGLIILSLLLVACSETRTNTAAEAQAAFEAYVDALNKGNIDTAAQIYDLSPGFHWIERGGIQYDTGAAAAASLKSLSENGGSSKMTLDNLKVVKLAEDAALVSSHFNFVMFSKTGEEQFSFDGWMTVGMAKRNSGWKIAGGQTGPGESQ